MYIALHTDADRKKKAILAARDLGMTPRQFIIRVMVPIWWYTAEQAGDGELVDFDIDMIEVITEVKPGGERLLSVLTARGWLVKDGENYKVKSWDEHQPFFAERARKKREYHAKKSISPGTSRKSPKVAGTRALEEKRVEEKRVVKQSSSSSDDVGFKFRTSFWPSVPRKVGKEAAFKAFKKLNAENKLKAIESVKLWGDAWLNTSSEQKKKCCHPSTWLNEGRYDDDPEEWKRMASVDRKGKGFRSGEIYDQDAIIQEQIDADKRKTEGL